MIQTTRFRPSGARRWLSRECPSSPFEMEAEENGSSTPAECWTRSSRARLDDCDHPDGERGQREATTGVTSVMTTLIMPPLIA